VAQVVYSENALRNIERVFEFLAEHDPGAAADAVEAIRDGVDTLGAHPFIGRRVEGELRELVISFGRTGYVALYRYLSATDLVRVLAIRHQRELDYPAREGEPPGLDR
jgi:plasmid stabilization system protein ParE